MRIVNPQNIHGEKLISEGDFRNTSLKIAKVLNDTGSITLTYEDVPDIELWELSNTYIKMQNAWTEFLADATKNEDGSITVRFREVGESTNFTDVAVILKRSESEGVADELVITIEVKIKRYMGKTLRDSKLEDYDVDANIAGWKALGVEAKTTEPDNYPYADCSTAAELTAAGFDLNATTIGSDVCLISLDTVNNSSSGTRPFPNVQTFGADLPSLKNGSYMFFDQTNLQTFSGKIPNLTNATGMFYSCTGLTEWTVALPNSLTDASYMFYNCFGLTEWNVPLPNSLTNASGMFDGCTGLTSWTVALPNSLTNASGMFEDCSGLTEWNVPLPDSLTNASYMFYKCTGLSEWNVPLPDSLTNAFYMFYNCSGLTEWNVPLPDSLTNAFYMFQGCKLNKPSVQRIADSIPTHTSGTHQITIGIDSTQITQAEQDAFNATIVGKGWTVTWDRN